MSLWSRIWRHTPTEPNRHHRRSLARLSRPDRAQLHSIIQDLKKRPLEQRARIVARLPEWQQDLLKGKL